MTSTAIAEALKPGVLVRLKETSKVRKSQGVSSSNLVGYAPQPLLVRFVTRLGEGRRSREGSGRNGCSGYRTSPR